MTNQDILKSLKELVETAERTGLQIDSSRANIALVMRTSELKNTTPDERELLKSLFDRSNVLEAKHQRR